MAPGSASSNSWSVRLRWPLPAGNHEPEWPEPASRASPNLLLVRRRRSQPPGPPVYLEAQIHCQLHSAVRLRAKHNSLEKMISSNVAFEQQTTKMPQTEPANRSQVPAKVTKIRRSRQPRNPQLSVARRNERERNRVKMVNNGFALLREHLPVEDLKACEQSGSDTPTPGDSKPGKAGAKKFSKVETLRAAIQRIRMLEELIRSTEPEFESINIVPSAAAAAAAAAYELGEEPLSEPLSCGSASSQSAHSLNANHQIVTTTSHHHYEHFVKLEPHHQQQVTSPPNQSQPSPQNSQHSHTSGHHQYNQAAQEPPSHTHLWIQQHQSSFLEQQQQHYQQQHWYQPQPLMDQKSWFVPSDSPDSNNQMGSQQQQHNHNHHHLLSQQQQQLEPVWFQSSPGEPLPQMAAASSSQPSPAAFATGHSIGQHHQISLYSQ